MPILDLVVADYQAQGRRRADLHRRSAARPERVETDEPSPNPSLEADKLKADKLEEYLERMDPRDFGKFNP